MLQVVHAFFLNDKNQYVEVDFSPSGRYSVVLFSSARKHLVHSLPLPAEGRVVQRTADHWTMTSVIPREYLPVNIIKFNAYAIHGRPNNIDNPSSDDIVYEALYPADPAVMDQPNFHYLEGFKPINLALIGFKQNTLNSLLWEHGLTDHDYEAE